MVARSQPTTQGAPASETFGEAFWRVLSEEIKQRADAKLPPPSKEEKVAILNKLYDERLSRAIKAISTSGPPPSPQPRDETPKNSTGEAGDEAWLKSLEALPAYKGIDVRKELERCQKWCREHDKTASRSFFESWLRKAEAPIKIAVSKHTVRTYQPILEPRGWREHVRQFANDPANADRSWSSFDRAGQLYIIEQMAKQSA